MMLKLAAGTVLAACMIGPPSYAQESAPPRAGVPTPTPQQAAPATDEHDAAVRQLIEVTGTSVNGGKLVDQLFEVYKSGLPQIPAPVWDDIRTQLATEEFADLQAAVYKKHFTLEEIKGLLQFFRSPIGQRYIQEMPGLMKDGMAMGQEFSRRIKERLDRCLQQKGYTVS
jgi:hypothetical protein